MNSNSNEIVLNYESNSDTHSHSHSHSKSFYPEIYDELIKIFPTCDDNTKIVSLVKYLYFAIIRPMENILFFLHFIIT